MEEKKLKRMLKQIRTKYKADFDSLAKGMTPEEYEKLKREEQLKKETNTWPFYQSKYTY